MVESLNIIELAVLFALFQFLLIAYRQLMTALGTTAGQHFSSIGSLHTLTETMNSFTTTAMRLKCTFHLKLVFSRYQMTRGEPGLFQFTYRSPHPLVL